MTTPQDTPAPPPPGQRVNRYGQRGALTPDLHDRIVEVVRAGNYLKTAAQFAGIGVSTLSSWLARGRAAAAQVEQHADDAATYCPDCGTAWEEPVAWPADEPPPACPGCRSPARPRRWQLPQEEERYLAFLEAVTQAETVAEVSAVTHWRRAWAPHDGVPGDWRAARDYLARKRPEMWAAKTTVTISSEEAEARIERATLEALTALGVDTDGMGVDGLDDDGLPDPGEL